MAKTKTHQWKGEKKEIVCSFKLFTENQFLSIVQLSHCFCQLGEPSERRRWCCAAGGWRVCCYLLQQALIPCSTSFVCPLVQHLRKTSPGQSPLFPPGCWFVAPWPCVQAVILQLANKPQWHDPSFFSGKTPKKKENTRALCCSYSLSFAHNEPDAILGSRG